MAIDIQVQIRMIEIANAWVEKHCVPDRDDLSKQRITKAAEAFDQAYKAIVKTVTETTEK